MAVSSILDLWGSGLQDDHKAHRDRLIAAITALGGTPVEEKSLGEYAQAFACGSPEWVVLVRGHLAGDRARASAAIVVPS